MIFLDAAHCTGYYSKTSPSLLSLVKNITQKIAIQNKNEFIESDCVTKL